MSEDERESAGREQRDGEEEQTLQDLPILFQPVHKGTDIPEMLYKIMMENGLANESVQNPTDLLLMMRNSWLRKQLCQVSLMALPTLSSVLH